MSVWIIATGMSLTIGAALAATLFTIARQLMEAEGRPDSGLWMG